jgi:hypothetical protein
MDVKEVIGVLITLVAIIVLVYAYASAYAMAGGQVKGDIALYAAICGFIVILLGPYLWLGEVPTAVKKFVEAKTGVKLEEKK